MISKPFHHPYRLDDVSLQRAGGHSGIAKLIQNSQLPDSFRFLPVNPADFTHAYLLLGKSPRRFLTEDLSLYLSTIRTFFERVDASGGIAIPVNANSDARRRIGEDLAVGMATYFMVEVFGLAWETTAQIPQNSQLKTKRPDFLGFSAARPYIFESKGTTALAQIEKALSNAMDQVKAYPETADAKLAIISYLSADERFFPSASFVVDPPAPVFPQGVELSVETGRFLHFEKVLQFAGLSELSQEYISVLSQQLREQYRIKLDELSVWKVRENRTRRKLRLKQRLDEQLGQMSKWLSPIDDTEFLGQSHRDAISGLEIFSGAARIVLENGVDLEAPENLPQKKILEDESQLVSIFSDGTILRITTTINA